MATVEDVIHRALRRYLYPAFDQPIMSQLVNPVVAGDTEIVLQPFDSLEYADGVTPGTVIEVGYELMRVTDASDVSSSDDQITLQVDRAVFGTTDILDLDAGTNVIVAPQFPIFDLWKAAQEEIEGLYPDVWVVRDATLSGPPYYLPDDFADIVEVTAVSNDGVIAPLRQAYTTRENGARVLRFYGQQYFPYSPNLTYSAKPIRPTTPADDLDGLNCEDRWEDLIAIGVAIQMVTGQNVSDLRADYLTELGEITATEQVNPRSLEQSLRRARALKLNEERRRLRADQRGWVQMRSPLGL